jgi:hypothetical protein
MYSSLQRIAWCTLLTPGFFFAAVHAAITVDSTILVLAPDVTSGNAFASVIQGYGIPYQIVPVPQEGIDLPVLNSSTTAGNYGGIVTVSELSYDFNGDYHSAITSDQWQALYSYQASFGVRMVRLDVWPTADFGVESVNGGDGDDQPISISNATTFPTANIIV